MMTRKDYVRAAQYFNEVIADLCTNFKEDNPRFDEKRFRLALIQADGFKVTIEEEKGA
jgi:hypothetical protein